MRIKAAGQAELLLHAAGELARQPAGEAGQVGEGEQPVERPAPGHARHAAEVGVEVEVFLHRQVLVQAEPLGHVAHDAGGARRARSRCRSRRP